jgi:hypothetical protein
MTIPILWLCVQAEKKRGIFRCSSGRQCKTYNKQVRSTNTLLCRTVVTTIGNRGVDRSLFQVALGFLQAAGAVPVSSITRSVGVFFDHRRVLYERYNLHRSATWFDTAHHRLRT